MKSGIGAVAAMLATAALDMPAAVNLVPAGPGTTPNAWCTWATQNLTTSEKRSAAAGQPAFDGDQGVLAGRDNLHEAAVFGTNGWISGWEGIRQDLYFLFDDGWDVSFHASPRGEGMKAFGSLEVAAERFPSCKGTPAEQLKKLNDKVKAAGWKGAGFWIAAHQKGEHGKNRIPVESQRAYWEERMRWCREAGILYWKVDWGVHATDWEFRRMLTELGHKVYPALLIEHSNPSSGALNGIAIARDGTVTGDGRFQSRGKAFLDTLDKMMAFSGLTRVYDTLTPMTTVTTVGRAAHYLQVGRAVGAKGLINVEDEVYIGAGLGCAFAVMRSPLWTKLESDRVAARARRGTEVVRAVRWQRIAPAFAPGASDVQVSEQWLTDRWTFRPGSTWWVAVFDKTIPQSAPAIIARGVTLPGVVPIESGEVPYVVASRHPNGALAVATRPRLSNEKGLHTPRAGVAVSFDCFDRPVGIFGHFGSLTLDLNKAPKSVRVWGQDLAADHARDITAHVTVKKGKLTIPGSLIEEVAGPRGRDDASAPGMVLWVKAR